MPRKPRPTRLNGLSIAGDRRFPFPFPLIDSEMQTEMGQLAFLAVLD
jgi:hypothetical protein